MVQNQAEDRMRLRRVLPERAIALAMENRWSEAADINRKIIELYPNDADAYNRLGKALLEMGHYRDALATYQRAVELDPNSIIARRNVERLAHLADKAPEPMRHSPQRAGHTGLAEREPARINPTMFIEETGKTGVVHLVSLGRPEFLIKLTAGDTVELRPSETTLEVYDEHGQYVGQLEPKTAKRLLALIAGGNRYTAAVTTVAENDIAVLVRETYQHPSQRGKLSFPPKALPTGAYRPYMREGALRYGMEEDEDGMFDLDADDSDSDAEEADEETDYEEEDREEEEDV